ncbi:MAG TPA: hypothetical protein VGJ20_43320 [Xanthobacteraceae bacterium]|jgi:hypothetical protein
MINKAKLGLVAAVVAFGLASPAVALAQSTYTTGTAASREAAGYPSPDGYGSGLYAYAQTYGHGHAVQGRHLRGHARIER